MEACPRGHFLAPPAPQARKGSPQSMLTPDRSTRLLFPRYLTYIDRVPHRCAIKSLQRYIATKALNLLGVVV
jgi:hypothetical protein